MNEADSSEIFPARVAMGTGSLVANLTALTSLRDVQKILKKIFQVQIGHLGVERQMNHQHPSNKKILKVNKTLGCCCSGC